MLYQLTLVLVSLAVGGAIGIYLRLRHRTACESYGRWAGALDWRIFAGESVFFATLAGLQIADGYHLFAAMFIGLTSLAAVIGYKQRLKQSANSS